MNLLSQSRAVSSVRGGIGAGEAAPPPQAVEVSVAGLNGVESGHFDVGDAAGESFRGLPEQAGRGAAENE